MTNRIIELHDTTVDAIVEVGTQVIIFLRAYVHQSVWQDRIRWSIARTIPRPAEACERRARQYRSVNGGTLHDDGH